MDLKTARESHVRIDRARDGDARRKVNRRKENQAGGLWPFLSTHLDANDLPGVGRKTTICIRLLSPFFFFGISYPSPCVWMDWHKRGMSGR